MLHFPKKLSESTVLISNDDSVHSQGIKILEDIVKPLVKEVYVVAPENEQSAVGHSLSIHDPLRIKEYDDHHVSVFGTPTDSVIVGIQKVMKENKPDFVLSGINHGNNIADNVTYSGTVAAAIEAALLGYPAIALSQCLGEKSGPIDWSLAQEHLPIILEKMQGMAWSINDLININFPVAGIKKEVRHRVLQQGHHQMDDDSLIECIDPRGKPYYWIGPPNETPADKDLDDDIAGLFAGDITITPLSLNLTDYNAMADFKKVFS